MKMTAKDIKEITYIPLVTFFSVLERPGKNRKGVATTPLVRRGLNICYSCPIQHHNSQFLEAKLNYADDSPVIGTS